MFEFIFFNCKLYLQSKHNVWHCWDLFPLMSRKKLFLILKQLSNLCFFLSYSWLDGNHVRSWIRTGIVRCKIYQSMCPYTRSLLWKVRYQFSNFALILRWSLHISVIFIISFITYNSLLFQNCLEKFCSSQIPVFELSLQLEITLLSRRGRRENIELKIKLMPYWQADRSIFIYKQFKHLLEVCVHVLEPETELKVLVCSKLQLSLRRPSSAVPQRRLR